MIFDYSTSFNLQSKKYDWIKIAFILKELNKPMTANQINYIFNKIFENRYCNSRRISQILKSKNKYFGVIEFDKRKIKQTRSYYWNGGEIILHRSTLLKWNNKIKSIKDHY